MFTAFILGLATASILCLFLDIRNITGHSLNTVPSARSPVHMTQLENRHKGFHVILYWEALFQFAEQFKYLAWIILKNDFT
jgi:hypothetical protein